MASDTLPPLPEQRRIVAKLDNVTDHTARAREELERIPKLIQKYREAILAAAFSGELIMEWRQKEGTKAAWTKRHVGQIISAIVAGKNLRCEERGPLENENGVVKVSAVTWGAFDPSAAKTLPSNFIPPERTKIRAGDFLISRANTLELVGAIVIVDRTPGNLVTRYSASKWKTFTSGGFFGFYARRTGGKQSRRAQLETNYLCGILARLRY